MTTILDVLYIGDLRNIITEYAGWHIYKLRSLSRDLREIIPKNKTNAYLVTFEQNIAAKFICMETFMKMAAIFAREAQYDKMVCIVVHIYARGRKLIPKMLSELFALENDAVASCEKLGRDFQRIQIPSSHVNISG